MEGFMVDLKTFLSWAMPNQSCLDFTKQVLSWFRGDILGQEIPNLYDAYIYTVLLYCIIIDNTRTWIGNARIVYIQTSCKKSLWLPQEEHLALLVSYKLVLVDYSWCNYVLH